MLFGDANKDMLWNIYMLIIKAEAIVLFVLTKFREVLGILKFARKFFIMVLRFFGNGELGFGLVRPWTSDILYIL